MVLCFVYYDLIVHSFIYFFFNEVCGLIICVLRVRDYFYDTILRLLV